ncbi:hypothetical protein [Floridanema evergladense]|uniref:Uncharacterized protein n=1 Tax=Floridaenema evergladense BLCC-F167 TaxID=3153639 RepID=A0ABV4WUE5_9CYAN
MPKKSKSLLAKSILGFGFLLVTLFALKEWATLDPSFRSSVEQFIQNVTTNVIAELIAAILIKLFIG